MSGHGILANPTHWAPPAHLISGDEDIPNRHSVVYEKKSQKAPRNEIELAERRMKEVR